MKLKKILAAVAATAVALSTMAVNSFAALLETSLDANGAPTDNVYKVAGVEGVDYSKVAKIEAVVTTTDYVNGTIGVSTNGGTWTAAPQQEVSGGGSGTWVLDGLSGIDSTAEDGSLKPDVVQVQFWWLNAGTLTLDSVKLYDADGNVLQEVAEAAATEEAAPAAEEAADDEAAPEETSEEAVEAPADEEAPADAEAAADETVEEAEAPAADTTTDAAATGNVAVASIAAVMAIAGAAAVATKKRK